MCTGACSRVVGAALWPFALLCIVANLLLAFPNWTTEYVQNRGQHLTPEVLYLGGVVGGGIMVLVPAIHIQATGRHGCCANRCGMFLSVLAAAVGLAGSLYALSVSALGLVRGPLCRIQENGTLSGWERPFWRQDEEEAGFFSNWNSSSYLFQRELWELCREPEGVTEFNVILFSLILASSGVEVLLCALQVLNGFLGCLCGTCNPDKKPPQQQTRY
ncbi:transmembrane 4 L6 family member 5-like [Heteronotia binoei]|uniref:transmembrane 4 L6 family member 5-like n=1 Tax=Heteronotia binoei TaxID=13085 RepID=UPI00292FFBED|nr:transmembrane 4 L6 family member 5-like [Heteronotia binoei]